MVERVCVGSGLVEGACVAPRTCLVGSACGTPRGCLVMGTCAPRGCLTMDAGVPKGCLVGRAWGAPRACLAIAGCWEAGVPKGCLAMEGCGCGCVPVACLVVLALGLADSLGLRLGSTLEGLAALTPWATPSCTRCIRMPPLLALICAFTAAVEIELAVAVAVAVAPVLLGGASALASLGGATRGALRAFFCSASQFLSTSVRTITLHGEQGTSGYVSRYCALLVEPHNP